MKYLYFADLMGDIEQERKALELYLQSKVSNKIKVKSTDTPPFPGFDKERYFDVLLFDWGGMSIGNSMLEHFCNNIFEQARENESKLFIMTSTFTEEAMQDCILEMKKEGEPINNIFLNIDRALPL